MKEIKPAAYKTAEAAEYLNLSPTTVRKLSDTGQLPCVKLGNARYYPKELLDQWLMALPKWSEDNGQTA